jgi:hypothetical protein
MNVQMVQARPVFASSSAPAAPQQEGAPEDRVDIGYKAGGAVGAMYGAKTGKIAVPVGTSVLGGCVASSLGFGGVGVGIAAVLGLVGGTVLEYKTHAGKTGGGLLGGALGAGVGKLAEALGWTPSEKLQEVTRNFSLGALPGRINSRNHSSNVALRDRPDAVEAMKNAQPGDIIVFQDRMFDGATTYQRLGGASGDFTHIGVVSDTGTLLDVMQNDWKDKPLDFWLRNTTNMAILRPKFTDTSSAWKLVDGMRADRENVSFDPGFDLKTDDLQYCGEFAWKSLQKYAPEIHVDTSSRLGYKFIVADNFLASKDIDVVYHSGSSYWHNNLSKFA